MRIGDLLKACKGRLISGSSDRCFYGVSIDSRTIQKDYMFFALKGSERDGHEFVMDAINKGAAGAVVRMDFKADFSMELLENACIVAVDDPLVALGDFARWWRMRHSVKIGSITGSAGKTTTKEIVSSILEKEFSVIKSKGNWNNLIGLPLTLLELDEVHERCILEMGTNERGEIKRLMEIALPDVSVITNIRKVHLEKLGSLEGVAREKGYVYRLLPPDGIAIVNADDSLVVRESENFNGRKIFYSLNHDSDICIPKKESLGLKGWMINLKILGKEITLQFPLPGEHNLYNLLAATGVSISLGASVDAVVMGASEIKAVKGRLNIVYLRDGIMLIDDTYNASPFSTVTAMKTIKQFSGQRRAIAVLGDMKELGDYSEQGHREVGEEAARLGFDCIFAVGEFSSFIEKGARCCGMRSVFRADNKEEILNLLKSYIKPGDIVLIKGSRAMRMEWFVDHLKHTFGEES